MHECHIYVDAANAGATHSITLDRECYFCFGSGDVSGERCDSCEGTGYVLTDAGDRLLAFIERHRRQPQEKKGESL